MKRMLSILLMLCAVLHADEVEVKTKLSGGQRQDRLTWSIAGKHHKPNVLSELSFKHIKVKTIQLAVETTWRNNFARVTGTWGDITSGRVTDSDYMKSNRHQEFSRSISKIRGSYVAEGTIVLGHIFPINSTGTVVPLAGYANMRERFRFGKTIQRKILNPFDGEVYKTNYRIHHVNSTYKSRWDSPLIGLQANQSFTKYLMLRGEYQFLFLLKYHGSGYWNLRQNQIRGEFQQHSRRNKGFGQIINLGFDIHLTKKLALTLDGTYMRLKAKGGQDSIRLRHSSRVQQMPFRKALLQSKQWTVGLSYLF